MGRRYCKVVQSKSARSEPLSIGPKQLAEDGGEAGIERMANDDDDDDDDDIIKNQAVLNIKPTLNIAIKSICIGTAPTHVTTVWANG